MGASSAGEEIPMASWGMMMQTIEEMLPMRWATILLRSLSILVQEEEEEEEEKEEEEMSLLPRLTPLRFTHVLFSTTA
jgi:hypothetical protein